MTGYDGTGLLIVAAVALIAAIATWGVGRVAGRRIARRRPIAALILTAAAAPVALLGFGIVRFRIDSAAHPGSDWPVMAMAAAILFAGMIPAVSLPVAWLTLRRGRAGRR